MARQALSWALKSIGSGILFGIGFLIMLALGAYCASAFNASPVALIIAGRAGWGQAAISTDFKTDLNLVSYISYKNKRNAGQLVILGKIKNQGDIPWTDIEIQAELFNKGDFVEECRTYIKLLEPQNEENFKIVCGECQGDILPDHDKIDVRIVGAHKALY